MRVTSKYLQNWLTNKFEELEIPWVCYEVCRSYNRPCDIEGGACQLYFRIKHKTDTHSLLSERVILGFYSMGQHQEYLNSGYELWLKFDRYMILGNCEVDVRKTKDNAQPPNSLD